MNVLTNFEVTQQFLVASLNMLKVCISCVQLTQQFLGASLNLVCRPCVELSCWSYQSLALLSFVVHHVEATAYL